MLTLLMLITPLTNVYSRPLKWQTDSRIPLSFFIVLDAVRMMFMTVTRVLSLMLIVTVRLRTGNIQHVVIHRVLRSSRSRQVSNR
jgi:hypothetical protein